MNRCRHARLGRIQPSAARVPDLPAPPHARNPTPTGQPACSRPRVQPRHHPAPSRRSAHWGGAVLVALLRNQPSPGARRTLPPLWSPGWGVPRLAIAAHNGWSDGRGRL